MPASCLPHLDGQNGGEGGIVRIRIKKRKGPSMSKNLKLFAYLNIEHPMVAWEVAVGRMKSSCDNNDKNFGISLWQYNLLKKYSKSGECKKLINELKLEHIRQNSFPDRISRLRGLYFFKSEDDANAGLDRWGIPHRKKYISEVCFSASSITQVDSEWITWNLLSENTDWMEKYWAGEVYGETPLYEILGSGIGVVQNMELRTQAYKNILDMWPASTPLLAAACCAFRHKQMEEVAIVKPSLIRESDRIVGSYYINMNEFNNRESDIIAAFELCKQHEEVPPMVSSENPDIFFSIPDLVAENFEFKSTEAQSLYDNVHKSYGSAKQFGQADRLNRGCFAD